MKRSHLLILLATAACASAAELPNPLDLRGAILYALDHNYTILQARQQVKVEEGIEIQAVAPAIPNVNANGQYARNAAAISETFPISSDTWLVQLKATQAIFAGGGIRAGIRAARLNREAAIAALQATINSALLDVRTRFYYVLLTREQVQVQEDNVRLFQRQLNDTQNQFHAGSVSNFEVLRARVSLANAQPDLITARNNYRIAQEQLRQSLGLPAGPGGIQTLPEVTGSLDVATEKVDLDEALSNARAHRPELTQLAKQAAAGEQSVKQARAGYFPTISLFGTYEWEGVGGYLESPLLLEEAGLPVENETSVRGWLYGAQGNWAIFDGRMTQGKVRQAKAQLEQARLSQASEELAIDVQVRQAFSSLEEAQELVSATQQTVGQATEALRLANDRYHVGSATQLDVLTSQVSLTQAKTNQVQANYNYLVAVANLRQAIGFGDAVLEK